jgi:hypothetical protein
MLLGGATKIDSDGQAVLASLPIVIRDQAKAKIRWFFYILIPAYLIPVLIFIGNPSFGMLLIGTLIYIGLGPIFGIGLFELKAVLFGKLRHKYVLDEMHKNNKVLKWIIIGAIPIITHIGFIALYYFLMESGGMSLYAIVFLTMEIVIGLIVFFGFNRLFPRKRTSLPTV